MAPPRKISPDQLEFLNSHVEGYLDCGSSRSLLTKFWTTVNAAFFAKWPERQSLIEKGILPTPSEVQLSDSERDVILGKAIKDRKKVLFSQQSILVAQYLQILSTSNNGFETQQQESRDQNLL